MINRSLMWSLVTLIFSIVPIIAQPLSCPSLAEQALAAIGDNCADLSRNSACYGYDEVNATFTTEVPTDYFATPSDRTELVQLDTLKTTAMNTAESKWGVAVMNVQANLPNTIPGQGVLMLLVGEAEVQNAVDPNMANEIVDPLSTVLLEETDLHSSPSSSSAVIETLAANEIVLVDGFNTPRTWLRVVTDGIVAWVDAERVARLSAMDTLPIVSATNPTAMQAFYLSTGIGEAECSEADSMIAVQSPENITVDLTVNGVDIRVGSLITFQNLDDQTMNLTVHRGQVKTVFGNTISAGESAIGVMSSSPEQGGTIVAWGDPVPASEEDLDMGERAQEGMNNVARNNGWDEREVDDSGSSQSGEIIHIVSSGETLFGIGRQYDASLPAIVERNNLAPPYTLFAGQELIIPNPGSGFVGLPSTDQITNLPIEDEESTTSICDTLRLTSPLASAPAESVPYYWDGVAGATQYQVNIYDGATGERKGTFYTESTETSIVIGIGQLGVGGEMQWEVLALQNDQVICGTGLSPRLTHAAPVEVVPTPRPREPFYIDWYCEPGQLVVEWDNAGRDATVDITVMDAIAGVYTFSGSGRSGFADFSYTGYDFTSVVGVTSNNGKDSKTGNKDCP
jgi:hypothetical protein